MHSNKSFIFKTNSLVKVLYYFQKKVGEIKQRIVLHKVLFNMEGEDRHKLVSSTN